MEKEDCPNEFMNRIPFENDKFSVAKKFCMQIIKWLKLVRTEICEGNIRNLTIDLHDIKVFFER